MIEEKLQKLFITHKWTLALAESCTGGALAARLVRVPDCSLYFLGSVVAYANQTKESLLDVSSETLRDKGAVSEETAQEMALGALQKLGATVALSTTGIAGPTGGSSEKPVGTVSFAIASMSKQIFSWTAQFEGSREEIISQATEEALAHLFAYLNS